MGVVGVGVDTSPTPARGMGERCIGVLGGGGEPQKLCSYRPFSCVM